MKRIPFFVLVIILFITTTPLLAQEQLNLAKNQLELKAKEYNLADNDFAEYILNDHHVSRRSNVAHFYFQQQYKGIRINGAIASVHLLPNGDLLKVNNRFESALSKRIVGGTPTINAKQAIQAVVEQYAYSNNNQLDIVKPSEGEDLSGIFRNQEISLEDIPTRLMYQPIEDGTIRLAWDLSILEPSQQNWWSIRVDAATGEILHRNNWMLTCNWESEDSSNKTCNHTHAHKTATKAINTYEICVDKNAINSNAALVGVYNVYPLPVESPHHGVRSLVSNPDDPIASPFGWHDTTGVAGAEFTTTQGNNVNAYEDGDNAGFSPDGGSTLSFDYPVNTVFDATDQSEPAALTNLFYWSNVFHDVWYQYGFDEASGNFQENNYGNGGDEGDPVNAEAQDGSGTCNANMGTPPDGSSPRMQMYVCGDRDGDYDNGVIAHEYGHGFSIRLTGGASISGCLSGSEQMGEGWSDYFGMVMTIEPGDTGADKRGMGTWLFGQGPNGNGIRPQPYSTDMAINNQTYNDISSVSIPHGVGSVWCTMLWEMTWDLIGVYGFDPDLYNGTGGNNIAMALVTEGMKLQPCAPGFVDGRDAILAADLALYGGANECLIKEAFARRGLGVNASQGSSGSVNDGVESFEAHTLELTKTADISTAGPGTTITYTLSIYNPPTCGQAYTNVVLTDILPNHTNYLAGSASNAGSESGGVVSFTPIPTINPGATFTRSFSVVVDAAAPTAPYTIDDDMEGSTANWITSNSGGSSWDISTLNPHSGTNAWFAEDVGSNSAAYLQLANSVVPDVGSQLSFWHNFNTEATWDGGVVQLSTDDGSTWNNLANDMVLNTYNSTINNSSASPAFSGNSNGYLYTIVDLGAYANQTVLIRFWMHCDASVDGDGWYIDDVKITNLFNSIPNTASITADGGVSISDDLNNPTLLVAASCLDNIQNGLETGIDCGGTLCPSCIPTCSDGIQNGTEVGIDCDLDPATPCVACPPTCFDGILNQDEIGVDCGGASCPVCPTCDDNIQNQGETEVDCGGPNCITCPTCDDDIQNQDETGVDCGGTNCPVCPTCTDGIRNQDETGIDCGGPNCAACNCTDNKLDFTLVLDNYPAETTWELIDASMNIIDSGGNYANFSNGDTIEIELCAPEGCYDFIMYDSFGDGICCAFGEGSYELVNNADGTILASGGEFTFSDTTNFCLQTVDCINSINLTGQVASNTYQADIYVSSDGVVDDTSSVTFRAGNYIDLLPGFEIELNGEFLAEIVPCTPLTSVSSNRSVIQNQEQKSIQLAVNPTLDNIKIKYKLSTTSSVKISLLNGQGLLIEKIMDKKMMKADQYEKEWNTAQLAKGLYYLIFEIENGEKLIEKIVIN